MVNSRKYCVLILARTPHTFTSLRVGGCLLLQLQAHTGNITADNTHL